MTAPSLPTELQRAVDTAVGALDHWFDTLRGPRGYTGPIADWRRQGFSWTGSALDWRYEGIISGYVTLWRRTGNGHWLAKAQWAGDDLLAGQQPNGYFAAAPGAPSSGPPAFHGATCAGALLALAIALREAHSDGWMPYAAAAELAIHGALIGERWDARLKVFGEPPGDVVFLPHHNAAICETLFQQATLRAATTIFEEYALPALRAVVAQQVRLDGHPLDGAIPFMVAQGRRRPTYVPIAVARCVPALLAGYQTTGDRCFLEAAWRAVAFLQRWRNPNGSFPAVIYAGNRSNQYPQWIAATGDILRATAALRVHGINTDDSPTLRWLLQGQDGSGGITTARGLGTQLGQRAPRLPDVRDVRHVPGWCDKAFRALTAIATGVAVPDRPATSEQRCSFAGHALTLCEDEHVVEIYRGHEARYRWRKIDDWPTICAPEFVLE